MAKVYKEVRCTDTSLDVYDFEGSPEDVIERMQAYAAHHDSLGHYDLSIDICQVGGYGGDTYVEVECRYTRSETDKERDKRLAKAKKEREKAVKDDLIKQQKERAAYERLKTKYG